MESIVEAVSDMSIPQGSPMRDEISCHSDSFVLSQYEYYKNHLGGRERDFHTIHGLYTKYRSEAIRRGLLPFNA